jgi:hypothetical protein
MVQMKPVTQPADGGKGAIPYCWSWPLDFLFFGAAAGALYYALRPELYGLRSDRALRVYCQNLAVIVARRTHTIRVATIIYIL